VNRSLTYKVSRGCAPAVLELFLGKTQLVNRNTTTITPSRQDDSAFRLESVHSGITDTRPPASIQGTLPKGNQYACMSGAFDRHCHRDGICFRHNPEVRESHNIPGVTHSSQLCVPWMYRRRLQQSYEPNEDQRQVSG
jgi:hypothetical protein